MCYPENLAVSVNAIGVALAQGKTADELALMSAVFTQLADTLTTIGVARGICENVQDKQNQNEQSQNIKNQKEENRKEESQKQDSRKQEQDQKF